MDNHINIGVKPTAAYVLATISALNEGGIAIIQARGNHISKAVDVAEVVKSQFSDAKYGAVNLGTEVLDGAKVSCISIQLGA